MISACQRSNMLNSTPTAFALVSGSASYPAIAGRVNFFQMSDGVLVTAEVSGLPIKAPSCDPSFFGFHIHAGPRCTGSAEDPFADTAGHYNPGSCPHPAHAGDLPPLLGNRGYAYMSVFTNRFTVNEIINRTVIIHDSPDDFTTQPSGNSGKKIACGQIVRAGGRTR